MRDRAAEFAAAGCAVVGASFDPPEANKEFADAQAFGFPLLSDVDRSVGRAYGVTRDDDDQYAAYPYRVSYLIDAGGVVRVVYTVADVEGHADAVLADLARLRT